MGGIGSGAKKGAVRNRARKSDGKTVKAPRCRTQRKRGGNNGPSKPSLVAVVGEPPTLRELYDMPTIAANFGWSPQSSRLYARRGNFGPVYLVGAETFVEKKFVDDFLPSPVGNVNGRRGNEKQPRKNGKFSSG